MGRNHQKSMAVRMSAATRNYRARIGGMLSSIGLHAGQEGVLKALDRRDGQSMTELASTLGVQPPTVTKMVGRLTSKSCVERRDSQSDGGWRTSMTDSGRGAIKQINRMLKRVERQALTGIGNKDQKKFGRMLRRIARNLGTDLPDSVP